MTTNPRGAGRKPSGKTRHQISLMLSDEAGEWLLSQDRKAATVAEMIEELVKKANP
jgi:hypothetical protein